MRLAVAATPAIAFPTLDWLLGSEHDLSFIITGRDRPAGRGKIVRASDVATWGTEHDVEVIKPTHIEDLIPRLSEVDLLITIAFGTILPFDVFSSPSRGSVNMHFSLLPQWRGAAPVQRAIQNGDAIGGVTVFELDSGMDTGPIYVQERYPFPESSSAGWVLSQLALLGPSVISRSLEMVSQGISPLAQSTTGVSYARKITKSEAEINWSLDAKVVVNSIRAFNPEPGAWSLWRGAHIQILEAHVTAPRKTLLPGEVCVLDGEIAVGCANGSAIHIDLLMPAGKTAMTAQAWSNGARISVGESFGK